MKQFFILFLPLSLLISSCKKDFGSLNGPTIEQFSADADAGELNNLVSGTESGMRNNMAFYLDDVAIIGREIYHFSGSEPRYVTDLLGASAAFLSNSNFYITTPWAAHYRVVKNCNVLIGAANGSTAISAAEKQGYIGFAQTIKAYELLLNLTLTDSNGIRIDVGDPDRPGPFVGRENALEAIAALLDSGNTALETGTVIFPLAGFGDYSDAPGLAKVNRAIAARVAAYRGLFPEVLTNLAGSFYTLNGDFYDGVKHVFAAASGDQINQVFIPQNQNGEVRVAHPSYVHDIETGDDRIGKTSPRTTVASLNGLSSNRDLWVYTSSTAPIYIIRNEELILLYAEAKIRTSAFPDAVTALNRIREGHGLAPYTGASTETALTDEMLKQRRYSLYFEGYRWIDLRRYGRLSELPVDRTDDNVWSQFPIPVTEQ